MMKRIFLVGAGGGVLVSAAGWVPLRVFLPQTVLSHWMPERSVRVQQALGWSAAMAVLLLLTGFVAGRMSGARSRLGAMGAGAVAGWLAAWIAAALVGGAGAGVLGARNLLAHGLVPAQDQEQFISLIAESVLSIVVLIYASIFIAMLSGLILGGLGGLLAGRRGQAAAPQPRFWLSLVTISLTIAAFNLIVTSSTYSLLAQTVQGAIEKISTPMPYPASILFALPVGLSLLWLLFWQIVAWRVLQVMPAATEGTVIQSVIFTVLGALVAIPLLVPVLYGLFGIPDISGNPSLSWLTAVFWPSLVLLVLVLAHFLKRRVPEKVRVFFGRQGEARLLAVYFAALALLTLLLTIWAVEGGIGRHLWLLAGLVIGLGFAFLSLRAAWKSVPPAQGTPLTARDVFNGSALSLLVSDSFVALTILAPLALVLITVVMIARLMPENSSMPQGVQSVEGIVLTDFNVTFSFALNLILLLPLAASGGAFLLWKFWRWLNRGEAASGPIEQV